MTLRDMVPASSAVVLQDAEATFQKRKRKIAEALQCEAASGTSQTFSAALSAALACGVDVAVVKQHQARWGERRAAVDATIQSIAAKAPFDAQAFDGAVAQVLHPGGASLGARSLPDSIQPMPVRSMH